MVIHVVRPGESLSSVAREYGVPLSQLAVDNGLQNDPRLVVGQALVVQFPQQVHTVQPGESLSSIARQYGMSLRQLYRNNPILGGGPVLYPGQTLVISYEGATEGVLSVNGYAYPFIDKDLLQSTVPYLTFLTPFTYGFTPDGTLVDLDDGVLIAMAKAGGAAPLMHLSTLTGEGGFSNELAHIALTDRTVQDALISNLRRTLEEKGYRGLDVDFEYVFPEDASAYAAFLGRLTALLNPLGYPVIAALAPKTSARQAGLLYEGHDYAAVGAAVDGVLLMTYEWGYTAGPPMAVSPLPNVRTVLDYAVTEIPPAKIFLGLSNYGYDWPLPFVQGVTRAPSISNQRAIELAIEHDVAIQYDETAQAPFFHYTAADGTIHEVWFEDARSLSARLSLIAEYGFQGAGIWNLMRPFSQLWLVISSLYHIED